MGLLGLGRVRGAWGCWCLLLGGRMARGVPWGSWVLSLSLQYSTKEDKYEEEIKLLGEKLKEVRGVGPALHWCRHKFAIPCGF